MKLISALFFALTVLGCSSTYRVSDFSSKDKFYEDYNSSVKDKVVRVTMFNDSSLNAGEGTMIEDDTLIINLSNQSVPLKIPLSKVKTIKYKNNLLGAAIGIPIGIPLGFVAGVVIGYWSNPSNKEGESKASYGIVDGLIAGPIIGGIIGALLGYSYIYQFNL